MIRITFYWLVVCILQFTTTSIPILSSWNEFTQGEEIVLEWILQKIWLWEKCITLWLEAFSAYSHFIADQCIKIIIKTYASWYDLGGII